MATKKVNRSVDEVVEFVGPRLGKIDTLKYEVGEYLAETKLSAAEWEQVASKLGIENVNTLNKYCDVAVAFPSTDKRPPWGVGAQLIRVKGKHPKTGQTAVEWRKTYLDTKPSSTTGDAERAANQEILARRAGTGRTGGRDRYTDTAHPGNGWEAMMEVQPALGHGRLVVRGVAADAMGDLSYDEITGEWEVKFKISS